MYAFVILINIAKLSSTEDVLISVYPENIGVPVSLPLGVKSLEMKPSLVPMRYQTAKERVMVRDIRKILCKLSVILVTEFLKNFFQCIFIYIYLIFI